MCSKNAAWWLHPNGRPDACSKVADVAKLLGRSRPWVYEHAAELGAFRFGNGPQERIGFDRDAIERWKRDRQILKPAATAAPPRRRGRPRKNAVSSAVNLIPHDPSPYRACIEDVIVADSAAPTKEFRAWAAQ